MLHYIKSNKGPLQLTVFYPKLFNLCKDWLVLSFVLFVFKQWECSWVLNEGIEISAEELPAAASTAKRGESLSFGTELHEAYQWRDASSPKCALNVLRNTNFKN